MAEELNKLSPDLEWMLQSNQVDDTILIEVLVREYYQSIFLLALSKLTYPDEAHRVTQETLCIALSGERPYDEELGVYDWLAGIAEEICQDCKTLIDSQQGFNPRSIQSNMRRRSPEIISARYLKEAKKAIHAKVKSKKISGMKRARIKEILLLCIPLVLAYFLIQFIDLTVYSSDQATDSDQIAQEKTPISQVSEDEDLSKLSSTYSPPTSWPDEIPPQSPLNLNSTHDEILRRILISRNLWNNLWADVRVILYGPSNYIGPPRIERHQIWLDQEIGGIHLSGPLAGKPERFERITPSSVASDSTIFFSGIDDYSLLGSQIPWFYLSSDIILSTPYMTNFFTIKEENEFPPQRIWYTVVDEFDWANHKAVIVEMSDYSGNFLARFWLDAITGLALIAQYPEVESQDNILLEIQVSKIEFDVSFPLTIYRPEEEDLLMQGFAQDHAGQSENQTLEATISPFQDLSSRITPPLNPPSIGFDPSQSLLTFAVEGGPHQRHAARPVHVFGDSNYLGNIEITDLFRTICNRSMDGSRILLAQWPDSPSQGSSKISEYDLLELSLREYTIPETYITLLSFSPDNRHIAVVGISPHKSRSTLYILDRATGEPELIPAIEDIWSLAWDPNGNQLAILNWPTFRIYTQSTLQINLFDLETGKTTLYSEYGFLQWGKSKIEVPIADWKASFNLAIGGLEPCAAPPNSSPEYRDNK